MSPRRARAVSGRVGDDPATALHEHLIDAAERLLATTPVTAITTRDIARAAEVSDGVLYNYFADKNDLLVAAILRRYRSVVGRFIAAIPEPGSGSLEENLVQLTIDQLALAGEIVPMLAGLLAEPLLFHRVFAAIHEEPHGPQQLREPLVRYLVAEQRLARIAPDVDTTALPTILLGATGVLSLTEHVAGLPGPVEEQIGPIVQMLVRGLRPE